QPEGSMGLLKRRCAAACPADLSHPWPVRRDQRDHAVRRLDAVPAEIRAGCDIRRAAARNSDDGCADLLYPIAEGLAPVTADNGAHARVHFRVSALAAGDLPGLADANPSHLAGTLWHDRNQHEQLQP